MHFQKNLQQHWPWTPEDIRIATALATEILWQGEGRDGKRFLIGVNPDSGKDE